MIQPLVVFNPPSGPTWINLRNVESMARTYSEVIVRFLGGSSLTMYYKDQKAANADLKRAMKDAE